MAQSQTGTSGGKATQAQSGMQGASGMQGQTGTQGQARMRTADAGTGTDNVTYDIVSVVYHALHAAQTYQQYEQDAQRGNAQIAEFFRKVCDDNKQCAQEGLELLQQCLSGQGTKQGQSGQSAQGDQGTPGESGQHGRGTR